MVNGKEVTVAVSYATQLALESGQIELPSANAGIAVKLDENMRTSQSSTMV
jgi:hypothetical protein